MKGKKIISLLNEGKKIALTSDAGYPGISDPGSILIRHCIENDIAVSVINGANAFIPALIGSGLDTTHFYFHGFLSIKYQEKKKEIAEYENAVLYIGVVSDEACRNFEKDFNDSNRAVRHFLRAGTRG